jgi:hypothetical protein
VAPPTPIPARSPGPTPPPIIPATPTPQPSPGPTPTLPASNDDYSVSTEPVDLPSTDAPQDIDADPTLLAQVADTRHRVHMQEGRRNVEGPAGVGVVRTVDGVTSAPRGAPPPNMADRHVLENLNFFKAVKDGPGSGNSYLLQRPSEAQLNQLYGEAWNRLPGQQGNVTLSNGQTWNLNKTTGKFFPVEGNGIVNLTQQEVRFLETATKQIKGGTSPPQALENMGRAMGGQKYTVTSSMQTALESLGTKLGYSADDLGRAIAPHLPAAATASVPPEAHEAAKLKAGANPYRFVKWGGRTLLVVGAAMDLYEVYNAQNKPKTIVEKAGAWGASMGAGAVAAKAASPLLAGGPWGWAGYGAIVVGASVGGYFVGGEVAKTVYEWTFE